jgi:hypothetical protein
VRSQFSISLDVSLIYNKVPSVLFPFPGPFLPFIPPHVAALSIVSLFVIAIKC